MINLVSTQRLRLKLNNDIGNSFLVNCLTTAKQWDMAVVLLLAVDIVLTKQK